MLDSRCFVKAVISSMIDGNGKLIECCIFTTLFHVANVAFISARFLQSIFAAASVQYFIIGVVYDYWSRVCISILKAVRL